MFWHEINIALKVPSITGNNFTEYVWYLEAYRKK